MERPSSVPAAEERATPRDGAVDVSVVLPSRNGRSRIVPTIDRVLASMAAVDWSTELVFVDNASDDGTAAFVRARWGDRVHVVSVAERGTSSAKNGGVRAAGADVLLFVDDDVHVPLDWVRSMATPLRDGTADIVCGAIRLAPHLDRPGMTDFHRGLLADTGPGLGDPPRTVHGASMAARRAVFDAGVWFHPELGVGRSGFMEEHHWFVDALDRGFHAVWNGECVVEHHVDPARLERQGWLRRARAQGRSEGLGRARYATKPLGFRDLGSVLRAALRRAGHAIVERRAAIPSERHLTAVTVLHARTTFLRECARRRGGRGPVAARGVASVTRGGQAGAASGPVAAGRDASAPHCDHEPG